MLTYEVRGEGAPVTLLHGFMQDRESWSEVIDLVPGTWRWVLIDLPGHGASHAEVPAMAAASTGVLAVWDQLGIERSHLAGYSMGGRVALYLAARHPDRLLSLLTIGAHAGLEGEALAPRRASDEALAAEIEARGIEWFAAEWPNQPLFAGLGRRGPELLARLDAMRRRQQAVGVAAALRGMGAGAGESVWDQLGALTVPALFVAGVEDGKYVAAAERLASAVPHGRAVTVPEAGHSVHLEQPQRFVELLADHLSSTR